MTRQADRDRVLLDATLMDNLPAMQRALTAGADVDVRDAEHQETPLLLARSPAAARLLLDHGADINARDDRGRTAFLSHRWPLLAEHGCDINAQDADGETALMKAVMGGDPQDVAQVLALGTDPNVRARDGRTALDIAVAWGLVAITERLTKDIQP